MTEMKWESALLECSKSDLTKMIAEMETVLSLLDEENCRLRRLVLDWSEEYTNRIECSNFDALRMRADTAIESERLYPRGIEGIMDEYLPTPQNGNSSSSSPISTSD